MDDPSAYVCWNVFVGLFVVVGIATIDRRLHRILQELRKLNAK